MKMFGSVEEFPSAGWYKNFSFRCVDGETKVIWQPFMANNKIDALEKVQNKCLRIITTQAKSSPQETLGAETGIPRIRSIITANCMRWLDLDSRKTIREESLTRGLQPYD
jgi:hypothetical protein